MLRADQVYYLFQVGFNLGMGFQFTRYVPWLREVVQLSQAEVLLLNSAFWFATFLLEVPTGMVADGRGRGFSLIAACGFMTMGGGVMYQAQSFHGALLGELTVAVGQAFLTGALRAWLNLAPDRPLDIGPTLARGSQLAKGAGVVGVILSHLPYFEGAGFWLGLAGLMGLTMMFAVSQMRGREEEHPLTEWQALGEARQFFKTDGSAWWNAGFLFLVATTQWFNLGWAIVGVVILGEERLPFLWALIVGPQLIGAELARRRPDWQTPGVLVLAAILVWMPMVAFVVDRSSLIFVGVVVLHEGVRGFLWPTHDAFQLKGLPVGAQATILSMYALADDLGMALWSLIGAVVYEWLRVDDPQLIITSWVAMLGINAAGAGLLWFARPRSRHP
jgi:hypothetical protein